MVSRFRVKQPSAKQPLPIYKESQLPDLIDATAIQRAAPQIETGVEKEEEEEVCVSVFTYNTLNASFFFYHEQRLRPVNLNN
jgi:hypothetical protein